MSAESKHRESRIAVTVLGPDRPAVLESLTRSIRDCGCSIADSRAAKLGRELSAVMLLTGNWNAVAKLESALPRLAAELGVEVRARRTEEMEPGPDRMPYAIEVVALDRPGIVHDITSFFAERDVNVEDLHTSRYPAPHTGATMFAMHMTVGVPADAAIASVRGDFMDLCDDLNLDAMMAPVK